MQCSNAESTGRELRRGPRVKDLAGQVFHGRKVLQYAGKAPNGSAKWDVQCKECGGVSSVMAPIFKLHGCPTCASAAKRHDLTGRKFGKWTVTAYAGFSRSRTAMWVCRCDCGSTRLVQGAGLRSGKSTQCKGCGYISQGKNQSLPDAAERAVFRQIQGSARRRGLSFNPTREEVAAMTQQDCTYCGSPPSNTLCRRKSRASYDGYKYNGLDRVDNEVGYETGNCVPCCKKCNFMKNDATQPEFRDQITKIYKHWIEGK